MILDTVTEACTDLALANSLELVRRVFSIICIIVPIFLIVMGSITLLRYVTNPPEQEKDKKRLVIQFAAAIIIFFLPSMVNVVLNLIPSGNLNIVDCWNQGK